MAAWGFAVHMAVAGAVAGAGAKAAAEGMLGKGRPSGGPAAGGGASTPNLNIYTSQTSGLLPVGERPWSGALHRLLGRWSNGVELREGTRTGFHIKGRVDGGGEWRAEAIYARYSLIKRKRSPGQTCTNIHSTPVFVC